jgi:hypothetical protein
MPASSAYGEDLTDCDGSTAAVQTAMSCTFAFTGLMSAYQYTVGDLVRFRARARNSDGWGDYSSPNSGGATVMMVPVTMGAPVEGASTSSTQIQVTWSALTSVAATGGTAITSYELDWDGGGSGWTALVGSSTTYTSTSYLQPGVTAGTLYQLRLRASNALGWGAYGPTLTVVPSSPPAQMATLTTSVSVVHARIAWVAPDSAGAALTAYRILIAQNDGTMTEQTQYCNGADPSIITAAACLVPMSVLRSPPYSLTQGVLIVVQGQALNLKGWGPLSASNTAGAVLETEPLAPGAPSRLATTDDTRVDVAWAALITDL